MASEFQTLKDIDERGGGLNPAQRTRYDQLKSQGTFLGDVGGQAMFGSNPTKYFDQMRTTLTPYVEGVKNAYTQTMDKTRQMGSDFLSKYQSQYQPAFQQYMEKLGINRALEDANRYGDYNRLARQDSMAQAKLAGMTVGQQRQAEQENASRFAPLQQVTQDRLQRGLSALPTLLETETKPLDIERGFVADDIARTATFFPKGAEVELNTMLDAYSKGIQMSENEMNRMIEIANAERNYQLEKEKLEAVKSQQGQQLQVLGSKEGSVGYYNPATQQFGTYQIAPTKVSTTQQQAIAPSIVTNQQKKVLPYNQTTGEQSWQGSAGIGGKNYVYDLNELTEFGNPNDKLTNPYTGQKYNLQPGY